MSECCVVLVCLGCPLTTCKAWSDIVLLFVLWRQLPQTPEQTKESCFLKDSGLKTRSVAVPFSLFSFKKNNLFASRPLYFCHAV